ncbi:MAG: glycosyltransferase [Chloroflexota bacterium]|nr:glycosyltransferase [Chloroflexota bacterium]
MHSQNPDVPPDSEELQPHLARLADGMQSLDELLAGASAHVQIAEALSAVARMQECLDLLAAHLNAPQATPSRPSSSRIADEHADMAMKLRRVGEVARSLHAVREDVLRDASFSPADPPDQALVEVELELLRLVLPEAHADKPDIYLWGVIDWHFRYQRPQHLASVMAARGHRVFYVSNQFIDRPYPGFTLEPLDRHGRLHQVQLYLTRKPQIYTQAPSSAQVFQLDAGLEQLAAWIGANQTLSILQHPYWLKLAGGASSVGMVYDCLDHQAGFADNSSSILAEEHSLLKSADLVVATSQWLKDELGAANRHVALIRNAGEFEFFSRRPESVFADPAGRKVIGYYGAMEAWFDLALARAIAQRFPEHLVLLIGKDMIGASKALADLPNVHCNHEVNYAELPSWLYGFDVCLLPFQVLPLTLATNPVKIYEYLGAGKPVVAVDLPEMAQFGDLIRTASTYPAFLDAIAETLDGREDPSLPARRQAFAAQQTWEHRVDELEAAVATIRLPRVSVIVVTYGNLRFTRNCLESVQRHSDWADLEVIVVDNGSQDGTPEFLQSWRDQGASRHVILNADNHGFAAANNQGLAMASGDYLILLNNDTFVTRGWVRGLLTHLRSDERIGMVGPVTNNIGNEARIQIDYSDMEQMAERSRTYTTLHRGRSFDIPTLAFFCVAMPRATYEKVGPLDEAFEIGFFEDDDYCRRIEQAGLRVVCAEDVYVHHHLSASFDQLKQEDRQALFERNKLVYENKWGAWRPHTYR